MKRLQLIFLIIGFIIILFLLYEKFAFLDITVKFDKLEPFEKQMNVYYKGFKIGHSTKIYPDKHYENTFLKMRLYRSKINLPSNSKVKVRKIKTGSYIDIIMPDSPTLSKLKNNDEIEGIIAKDINSIFEGKFTDEDIDVIVDDAAGLISNASEAIKNLSDIFLEINGILKDVRPDIKTAACNLAQTTDNLKESSNTIKKSIQRGNAQISMSNITESTENLKNITSNVNDITKQINEISMPLTNSILCETQGTMTNMNEMTSGLNNTMKKHFGMGRLLFGRPVNNN